jgi:glycerol kinase
VAHLLAVDAGTTGVRALVVDAEGAVVDLSYRALTQHYPEPGWVEHDAAEIWGCVVETLAEVVARHDGPFAAIGITNQRETVVAWDRADGRLLSPALVWQDRRTTPACSARRAAGEEHEIRARTGLVLDPYFSATKMAWLLESGRLDAARRLALGTVDAWILWNLTGATDGGRFATDGSNASRTMLFDLDERSYAPELLELFGVPEEALAEVLPSCGRFANLRAAGLEALAGTPISGILGDQQAALFGQRCFRAGMVKVTYGTGAFVLSQEGTDRPPTLDGLLTTLAWDLGEHGGCSFALEGSAFIAGAAISWLRDELGVIAEPADLEELAATVDGAQGLSFIPAFVGLGSPWWDETARGALFGITRGSGRAQLANAVIDALSFEVRAITDAMAAATGGSLRELRADGGAAAMDLLLERQATQSNVTVTRAAALESTAAGAALIAGLAEGVVGSLDELSGSFEADATFVPAGDRATAEQAFATWLEAAERSRGWAQDPHG